MLLFGIKHSLVVIGKLLKLPLFVLMSMIQQVLARIRIHLMKTEFHLHCPNVDQV